MKTHFALAVVLATAMHATTAQVGGNPSGTSNPDRIPVWTGLVMGYDQCRADLGALNDSLKRYGLARPQDKNGGFTFGWLTAVARWHIQFGFTFSGQKSENDTARMDVDRGRVELWIGFEALKSEKWHVTPFTGYSFSNYNYRYSDTDDGGTFGALAGSAADEVNLRHIAHMIPYGLKISRGVDARLTLYGGSFFMIAGKWQNGGSMTKVKNGPELLYPWFAGITLDLGSETQNNRKKR